MVDFITENPVSLRRAKRQEDSRAQQLAQIRQDENSRADMRFQAEQDQAKQAAAADAAQRGYISASLRPQRTPIPANGPIANPAPEQPQAVTAATPGFNPDAPSPQKPQAVNVRIGASTQPVMSRDPALEQLLKTPGTGKFAMEQIAQRNKAQDDAEASAVEALAQGDMVGFSYWQKRSGLRLPESVIQNRQQAQQLGQAMTVAKEIYGEDAEGARAFTIAYMQNPNLAQALENSPPPKGKESWSKVDLWQNGQQVLGRFNVNTGEVDIASQGGQPVATAAPGGQGDKEFLFNAKVRAYRVAFSGDPNVERNAVLFANGQLNLDQTDARDLAWKMAQEMVKANGGFLPGQNREATQEDYKVLADQFYQDIQSTGGRSPSIPTQTVQQPTSTQQPTYEEAPRDPAQRTVGQTYNTPQGPLIWQGQGWQRPQTSN